MEFLKVSDKKTKIILTREECRELGIFESDSESVIFEKIVKLFDGAENDFEKSEFEIALYPRLSGGLEISLSRRAPHAEIHTFVFNENALMQALNALKNTDFEKNSTLYKTLKTGVYIWEILSKPDDVIVSRLSDFAKEVDLSLRRDYLSSCAERIEFFKTEDLKNEQAKLSFKNLS